MAELQEFIYKDPVPPETIPELVGELYEKIDSLFPDYDINDYPDNVYELSLTFVVDESQSVEICSLYEAPDWNPEIREHAGYAVHIREEYSPFEDFIDTVVSNRILNEEDAELAADYPLLSSQMVFKITPELDHFISSHGYMMRLTSIEEANGKLPYGLDGAEKDRDDEGSALDSFIPATMRQMAYVQWVLEKIDSTDS